MTAAARRSASTYGTTLPASTTTSKRSGSASSARSARTQRRSGRLGPGGVDHVRVAVHADDVDAAAGELHRDAPGAAPGVEHRPGPVGLHQVRLAVRVDAGRREPLPPALVGVEVDAATPGRPVRRERLGHGRRLRVPGRATRRAQTRNSPCTDGQLAGQSQTAPRAAVPTSFAYLARTPRLCLGGGAHHCARRRASSSASTSRSSVRVRHVEHDLVAVADQRDRAALGRLGGDVPDAQPRRRSGEATVGHQQHVLAQPGALDRSRDGEHLPHARDRRAGPRSGSRRRRPPAACRPRPPPWRRPRPRTPGLDPTNRVGVETRALDHGALGRERPAQDR